MLYSFQHFRSLTALLRSFPSTKRCENHFTHPIPHRLQSPCLLWVHLHLIATNLLDALKGRLTRIQLPDGLCFSDNFAGCWVDLATQGYGLIAAEPFAHVYHPSFAITKAFAQLLAFHGKILKVGWLETFVRRFALGHYAIGLLETLRQCEAWMREDLVRNLLVDGQKEEGRQLGSSIGF